MRTNLIACIMAGKPETSYHSGLESGTLITQAHLDFFLTNSLHFLLKWRDNNMCYI